MRACLVSVGVFTTLLALACGGPAPPSGYGPGMQPPPGAVAVPQVAGPVQTQDGALAWMDSHGRVTGLYPNDGMLFFGTQQQITYTRDPYGGWYVVRGGQLQPLGGMPPELSAWPGVSSGLPGGYQLPAAQAPPSRAGGGYDPASIQAMQNMNAMMHETNMTIINNMSSPSTDYYSNDGQYLGSW